MRQGIDVCGKTGRGRGIDTGYVVVDSELIQESVFNTSARAISVSQEPSSIGRNAHLLVWVSSSVL